MKGVREDSGTLQAYLRVNGEYHSKRFPLGTAARELQDWRDAKRVAIRTGADIPLADPDAPSFRQDLATYWQLKGAMPSGEDRRRDLDLWARVLSNRPRLSVTATIIRAQLERWRAEGYAGSTLNHRRTALMDLWTVLDGKSAANPVRDVPKYPEDNDDLRALSHALVYRILCRMRPSKTRARLRVMAWTGWPPAQIRKLRPQDIQIARRMAYVTPRRKGKGTQGEWLPLLPPAVTALEEFIALDAFGDFGSRALNRRFCFALGRLNAHRARFGRRPITATAYSLRHSFGVLVAALFKDDQVVQRLMLHSSPTQTQRYIKAARGYRLSVALATLATPDGISGVLGELRGVGETGKIPKKTKGAPGRA
jgi:integrase